jgi:hypothetical protein
MHGKDEECIQYFWLEKLKGRDHLKDTGVNKGKNVPVLQLSTTP